MRSKPGLIIFVVCAALLLGGCNSGLLQDLSDLGKLRQQLMDKYHEEDINVHLLNSVYLTISFINSPLNEQSEDQRVARATEAAQFVVKNFSSIQKIQAIRVVFVSAGTRLIFFHYSSTVGVFPFNNRGEPMSSPREEPMRPPAPANPAPASDDPLSPNIKFNVARNETDISLMRIQLEGEPNHDGLALVPSFTAKGDVRGPTRTAVAPDLVVFDFASYSEKKLFSSDMRLGITCDRGPEFLTTARLLAPADSGSNSSNAQFLTARIPFEQFTRIGKAGSVKVRLGQKQYQLKPDEIAALKFLADLIPPPANAGR